MNAPSILVSGLINLETTLRVERFPLDYFPVCYPFFGVSSSVSGVGFNLAKALTTLGNEVRFCSLIGQDDPGFLVQTTLEREGIPARGVLPGPCETAQSVILYDPTGRRQIHVDLKNIQELTYPVERFEELLSGADAAVMCNVNFSRALLSRARQAGKLVATDVHAIAALDDDYNRDFMQAADVLFMSHENLPEPPAEFARRVVDRYHTPVLVIGLGAQGALLSIERDGLLEHIPATQTRPVVNTIGAGDALFSAFLHTFLRTRDARLALRKAVVFASWKIGERGAAAGFLSAEELDQKFSLR